MQKIEDEMFAYKKRRDRAASLAEDSSKAKFEPFDIAKATAEIDPTIQAETLTLVSREDFSKHPVAGRLLAISRERRSYAMSPSSSAGFPSMNRFARCR